MDPVVDLAPRTVIEDGVAYAVMAVHGFLYFGGTEDDGPYRLEVCMVDIIDAGNDRGLVLQGFDYTIANKDRQVSQRAGRLIIDLPETTIMNHEIIDPTTGDGIAYETLAQDPEYRIGTGLTDGINDCFTYIERFITNIGIEVSSNVQRYFHIASLWYQSWSPEENERYRATLPIKVMVRAVAVGDSSKSLTVFSIPEAEEPACEQNVKRDSSCALPSREVPDASDIEEKSVLAMDPIEADLPAQMLVLDPGGDLAASSAPAATTDIDTKVTIARAGGVLTTFVTVGEEVLEKLQIAAADLLGPAFVILEFIGKQWKMVAIGSVNTAAAIAAGFAPEGPVGWIIDAAIFILFASKSTRLHRSIPGGDRSCWTIGASIRHA